MLYSNQPVASDGSVTPMSFFLFDTEAVISQFKSCLSQHLCDAIMSNVVLTNQSDDYSLLLGLRELVVE